MPATKTATTASRPTQGHARVLLGRVLYPDRSRVAGARVVCGPLETVADATGAFTLDPREAQGWRPIVDGTVRGLDGTPLPEVRCRLSMVEYQRPQGTWSTTAREVATDAAGRFVFHDVPPCPVYVRFNGYDGATSIDLDQTDVGRDLAVELVRQGAFHFESTADADKVRVLDEHDAPQRIVVHVPGGTRSSLELALENGQARAFVSETACWLVPVRRGRELARIPLVIRWNETAEVRD